MKAIISTLDNTSGDILEAMERTVSTADFVVNGMMDVGNISVSIVFNGNNVYDEFIGYYNVPNTQRIEILDERYMHEERNVSGIQLNRLSVSYSDFSEGNYEMSTQLFN